MRNAHFERVPPLSETQDLVSDIQRPSGCEKENISYHLVEQIDFEFTVVTMSPHTFSICEMKVSSVIHILKLYNCIIISILREVSTARSAIVFKGLPDYFQSNSRDSVSKYHSHVLDPSSNSLAL